MRIAVIIVVLLLVVLAILVPITEISIMSTAPVMAAVAHPPLYNSRHVLMEIEIILSIC